MLVVLFPDRDDKRAGVIRTMFMNEALLYRPTSSATADDLVAQLCDARSCTRRLTDDLTARQLMGPMLPIVNPILWEIGHVGTRGCRRARAAAPPSSLMNWRRLLIQSPRRRATSKPGDTIRRAAVSGYLK